MLTASDSVSYAHPKPDYRVAFSGSNPLLTACGSTTETAAMPLSSISQVSESARAAAARIRDLVRMTPLHDSPRFSKEVGAEVCLKLENLQHTGSFKLRGAANRLLTLSDAERAAGCVTASSGNHGAAVAYAMQQLDVAGVIFVPEQTSPAKLEAIRSYGGHAEYFGTDGLDTETHAREHAREHGMFYISPYNDPEVVAGQGSCGVEIGEQAADLDVIYVSVGGGGLVSGVGSVLKTANPGLRIVGCQPEASAVMAHSVEAGRILDEPSRQTLSDGTAGGVEEDSITFELCRDLVDEFVLVDEDAIAAAMRMFFDLEHQVIEGAAAVAVAAMLQQRDLIGGQQVAVLICGGNVSRDTYKRIL
jgi:threonine dehydratase